MSAERYHKVSVLLHWVMALSFFAMIASGLAMAREDFLEQSLQFQMFQWHKSLGVLLLLTLGLRILWRVLFKAPALPDFFQGVEKLAVKFGHLALYGLMIAMPITGWVMVSSSVYGLPTIVFGWFEWPNIPGIEANDMINKFSKLSHEWLGYAFIAIIAVHILAVVKHAIKDKYNLLPRMWFGALAFIIALGITNTSYAREYKIDYEKSEISFSGEHAGKAFQGVFQDWSANIVFDSSHLGESSIEATFFPESARTGDKMYDGALPKKDWFDVKNHPEAVFKSVKIEDTENPNIFRVFGVFTVKNESHPLAFEFEIDGESAEVTESKAEFEIDRLLYGLGVKSDLKAEWVSEKINVHLMIVASPI